MGHAAASIPAEIDRQYGRLPRTFSCMRRHWKLSEIDGKGAGVHAGVGRHLDLRERERWRLTALITPCGANAPADNS